MSGWLVIALVFVVLVVFWQLLELTFDLIGYWQAAHRREDLKAHKERDGSAL
jgi:NADH:ubiquinone oxidoreductase subunit 5 (subunit L)/multisubunit Na+/H+ antiporter MnhA subunit